MDSAEVMLLLGGNVGDVAATQERAIAMISERIGPVLARSRPHWTEPWGFDDPRAFLNQAVLVRTALIPRAVLEHCLAIERELGRERRGTERYTPRTIDIDILWMDSRMVDEPGLTLPHPRLHQRAFALGPAADLAPGWIHPALGRSVLQLLDDLRPQP